MNSKGIYISVYFFMKNLGIETSLINVVVLSFCRMSMLRFLTGSKAPQEKVKQSEKECKDYLSSYE